MDENKVVVFRQYPFETGQKIRIECGRRSGDWEVLGVTERKVRFRCPLSGREFECDRFCYFVEEREGEEWPKKD